MGSIMQRKRQDGSVVYRAQIIIKKAGEILHQESKSFPKKTAAKNWMERREAELRSFGGLEREKDKRAQKTVGTLIDLYLADAGDRIGKTKAQVLQKIKAEFPIAELNATDLTSSDILEFARQLQAGDRGASTIQNYLSHLSGMLDDACAAHDLNIDMNAVRNGMKSARRRGFAEKSGSRSRRPTLDELDRLMTHFEEATHANPRTMPMHLLTAFAIFSARRQGEICEITWENYDQEHDRQLVKNMKSPGQKRGNDVWVEVPAEAARIMNIMKRLKPNSDRIFPFNSDTVSRRFTFACNLLGIEDLHFHDLRHEAASRLIEMGRTIPQTASVTGHRNWQTLQRYSHLRSIGDKFEGWEWLDRLEEM